MDFLLLSYLSPKPLHSLLLIKCFFMFLLISCSDWKNEIKRSSLWSRLVLLIATKKSKPRLYLEAASPHLKCNKLQQSVQKNFTKFHIRHRYQIFQIYHFRYKYYRCIIEYNIFDYYDLHILCTNCFADKIKRNLTCPRLRFKIFIIHSILSYCVYRYNSVILLVRMFSVVLFISQKNKKTKQK